MDWIEKIVEMYKIRKGSGKTVTPKTVYFSSTLTKVAHIKDMALETNWSEFFDDAVSKILVGSVICLFMVVVALMIHSLYCLVISGLGKWVLCGLVALVAIYAIGHLAFKWGGHNL